VDAKPDPAYPAYYDDACSVIQGLDRYKRILATSAGEVELTYFDNLAWNGSTLERVPKPAVTRDFTTFQAYRAFLAATLAAVAANMADARRRFRLSLLGTLSSGYDSTAVATLGRDSGLREVISFESARGGDADSGDVAARVLGLDILKFPREAWRAATFAEIPFIASYSSAEDIVFRGAESALRGRVLLTGYHGDKIWDKRTQYLSDQIVRGDPSGLPLTEYRLSAGFINCAVPFWGVRQIRDVHALSNSANMKEWDVPGLYSRPICRRIGEEAGIPRQAFGMKKNAVTMNPFAGRDMLAGSRNLLTPASLDDYLGWISEHRDAWVRRRRIPPIASAQLNYCVNAVHMRSVHALNRLAELPGLWRVLRYRTYQPRYLNRYLFPWALERMAQRYATGVAPARAAA
jgi:hypothetical protein